MIFAICLLRADSKSFWSDATSKDCTDAMFAIANTQAHKLPTRNGNLCTFIIYLSVRFDALICSVSSVIVNKLKYHKKCSHFVNSRRTEEEIRSKKLDIILRLTIRQSSLQHYVTLLWLPPLSSALWSYLLQLIESNGACHDFRTS